MSEQRRATLTPFGKSDKKSKKPPRKTFRLCFTLSDPNENSCPVFDYAATVRAEERKILKKHREEKDKKPNGFVDPFEDDDEDVKRLARKFEAKYGDKKKLKSYAELGAGYDETDPFIDNTDAYDEALGEDQETARGGYYINSGPLELRRVEANLSDLSDADEVKRRGRKRSLPVIDEDEEDDEGKEEEGLDDEGEEEEAEVESKAAEEELPSEPKKTKLLEERVELDKPPTPGAEWNGADDEQPGKKKKKKKRKRHADDYADGLSPFVKAKKSKTVKALLEEKRVNEQPPKTSEEPRRQLASDTSIAEAIESVVNNIGGSHHDENSNSTNSLHSVGEAVASSVSEDSGDGRPGDSPPPLPEGLAPEVVTLVNCVKQTAAVTDNTRKTFCPDINNCLVKLEWKTRELAAGSRHALFAHLAHHLPCTKDTLMRRAKKLFLQREESHVETVMCKLKATIDATMPTLLEEYAKECQRIAEEKGVAAGEEPPGASSPSATAATASLPRRRFPWTDETRGYLQSIVRSKQKCHRVSKPRKSSWEEFIRAFLQTKIRPLWPNGWMKTSILVKEINRSPTSSKVKHSAHHSPSKPDSRLNVSVSFASSTSSNGSLYISPSGDSPLPAKTSADPYNSPSQLTKPIKNEKPETFSMDCLLKRTSDSASVPDYNTTLSDLIKKEGVILNGASLPLKNVNSCQKNDSSRSEKILDLSSCNSSVSASGTPSVIQSVERTNLSGESGARASDRPHNYSERASDKSHGYSERASDKSHGYGERASDMSHGYSERASDKSHSYSERANDKSHGYSERASDKSHGYSEKRSDKSHSYSERASDKSHGYSERAKDKSHGYSERASDKSHGFSEKTSDNSHGYSERASDKSHGYSERASDKSHGYVSTPCGKAAMSNVPLNRKQRLLQLNSQTDWRSESLDVSVIKKTDCKARPQTPAVEKGGGGGGGGEVDRETTTATDILSQIISESLRSPPYHPPAKPVAAAAEEGKTPGRKDQELLFDVMQDLKELNHLTSGGAGRDCKTSSFTGASWAYPAKSLDGSKSTPYHNEFLNYISTSISGSKEASVASSTPVSLPYSRHNTSPYDNSSYVNEVNKSVYSHSPHRTSQSLTSHSTPSGKVTQMSQMKTLPNAGVSSGPPHRYLGQVDYGAEDNQLMGLASSLPFGLPNWPYPGSETQPHQ